MAKMIRFLASIVLEAPTAEEIFDSRDSTEDRVDNAHVTHTNRERVRQIPQEPGVWSS